MQADFDIDLVMGQSLLKLRRSIVSVLENARPECDIGLLLKG
jgi:hypothetical protein